MPLPSSVKRKPEQLQTFMHLRVLSQPAWLSHDSWAWNVASGTSAGHDSIWQNPRQPRSCGTVVWLRCQGLPLNSRKAKVIFVDSLNGNWWVPTGYQAFFRNILQCSIIWVIYRSHSCLWEEKTKVQRGWLTGLRSCRYHGAEGIGSLWQSAPRVLVPRDADMLLWGLRG